MLIALLFLLQLPAAAPLQPQDAASIEGIVMDGQTNRPLANVAISGGNQLTAEALSLTGQPLSEVLINGLVLQGSSTVITDGDGRFKLEQLRPGTMTLAARGKVFRQRPGSTQSTSPNTKSWEGR